MQQHRQDLLTQKKNPGINILIFFWRSAQMKKAQAQAGGQVPGLQYSATGTTHFWVSELEVSLLLCGGNSLGNCWVLQSTFLWFVWGCSWAKNALKWRLQKKTKGNPYSPTKDVKDCKLKIKLEHVLCSETAVPLCMSRGTRRWQCLIPLCPFGTDLPWNGSWSSTGRWRVSAISFYTTGPATSAPDQRPRTHWRGRDSCRSDAQHNLEQPRATLDLCTYLAPTWAALEHIFNPCILSSKVLHFKESTDLWNKATKDPPDLRILQWAWGKLCLWYAKQTPTSKTNCCGPKDRESEKWFRAICVMLIVMAQLRNLPKVLRVRNQSY